MPFASEKQFPGLSEFDTSTFSFTGLKRGLRNELLADSLMKIGTYNERDHTNPGVLELMKKIKMPGYWQPGAVSVGRGEIVQLHGGRVDAGLIPLIDPTNGGTLAKILFDPAILGVTWMAGSQTELAQKHPYLGWVGEDLWLPETLEMQDKSMVYVGPELLARETMKRLADREPELSSMEKVLEAVTAELNRYLLKDPQEKKIVYLDSGYGGKPQPDSDDRFFSGWGINQSPHTEILILAMTNKKNARRVVVPMMTVFDLVIDNFE